MINDTTPFHVPELNSEDKAIVEEYQRAGRSVDALPYTPAFESMIKALERRSHPYTQQELFQRLVALRKAGRLPRLHGAGAPPIHVAPGVLECVEVAAPEQLSSLSQRDRLPYTDEFNQIRDRVNAGHPRELSPEEIWRIILRLAK